MTESDVDLDDAHSGDVQFLDAIQQWLIGGRRRNDVGIEIVMRSDGETDEVNDLDGRFAGREDEREQTEMTDGREKKEELLIFVSLEGEQSERQNHGQNHLLVHVPAEEEEGKGAENENPDEPRRRRITTPQIDQRRRQGEDGEQQTSGRRDRHENGVRIFLDQTAAHRRRFRRNVEP